MSMMHSTWVLVTMIAFLVIVAGGVFLAIRMMAAHDDNRDHPAPRRP